MLKFTGFEVLTAEVMKNTIFWDITPCSPLKSTEVLEEHDSPSSGCKKQPSKKPT
jgi:hypothetical protein